MKNIKIFFFIVLFSSSINVLLGQVYKSDCVTVDNACDVQFRTLTINPAGYPKCELKINYRYRNCNGTFELIQWNINSLLSKNCSDYFVYLKKQLSTFEDSGIFWKELDKQVFNAVINAINTAVITNSGGSNFFDCNDPQGKNVIIKYYRASCIAIWIGQNDKEEDIAAQVPCDGSVCCNKISTSCYDPKTGKIVTKITNEKLAKSFCDAKNKPPFPKEEGSWDKASPCFAFCTEEDGIVSKAQINSNVNDEVESDFSFNNPVSDILNIKLMGSAEGAISIYSIEGKNYSQIAVNSNSVDVNVADLPKGIYILSWVKNDTIISKKLILE